MEKEVSGSGSPPAKHPGRAPSKKPALVRSILGWYRLHGRQLPWRRTRDPYAIWVSEIMLQQTQVVTVIPYYHAFLNRFPTVGALAAAEPDEVVKTWENLGYYHRAQLIHRAARVIVEQWQGSLPSEPDDLLRLPGIGPYTAGAVASIAFGKKTPALDGNAKRVYTRLFALEQGSEGGNSESGMRHLAQGLLPARNPGTFNQAVMDLGATLCKPRKPSCPLCPLNRFCLSYAQGIQDRLPALKKGKILPHKDMTASMIMDKSGKLLIVKRPDRGLLPGLWKLPGGERCGEGSLSKALERSVLDELGVTIQVLNLVTSVRHTFTHFRMTLHAFRARIREGRPRLLTCARLAWVSPTDLEGYAFSKADRTIIRHLLTSTSKHE